MNSSKCFAFPMEKFKAKIQPLSRWKLTLGDFCLEKSEFNLHW